MRYFWVYYHDGEIKAGEVEDISVTMDDARCHGSSPLLNFRVLFCNFLGKQPHVNFIVFYTFCGGGCTRT